MLILCRHYIIELKKINSNQFSKQLFLIVYNVIQVMVKSTSDLTPGKHILKISQKKYFVCSI